MLRCVLIAISFMWVLEGRAAEGLLGENGAIAAGNERILTGFNSGNIDGVMSVYAEDARMLPEGAGEVVGKEAIRSYYNEFIHSGLKMKYSKTEQVKVAGDMAIEIGKYCLLIPTDGAVSEEFGKYVTVWKRHGDAWLIDVEISNSDAN